jgi:hypothetical protein
VVSRSGYVLGDEQRLFRPAQPGHAFREVHEDLGLLGWAADLPRQIPCQRVLREALLWFAEPHQPVARVLRADISKEGTADSRASVIAWRA